MLMVNICTEIHVTVYSREVTIVWKSGTALHFRFSFLFTVVLVQQQQHNNNNNIPSRLIIYFDAYLSTTTKIHLL